MVVDDQPLMRHALEHFVTTAPDLELVGRAADGHEALEVVEELVPDVVLMDLQMPHVDGIEATRRIARWFPQVRVLAVTTFSSEQYLVPALQAGVQGYVVKDSAPDEIVDAIHRVHAGDAVFSPGIMQELIATVRTQPAPSLTELAEHEQLTPRELEVICELSQGKSNAEIGAELNLAEATVKSHLGRIMDKWSVRDRVQVLVKAAESGLVRIGN